MLVNRYFLNIKTVYFESKIQKHQILKPLLPST